MSDFLPKEYKLPDQSSVGLSSKEFNTWTDNFFITQQGNSDQYARMSTEQIDKIQWAKRVFARLRYNLKKSTSNN